MPIIWVVIVIVWVVFNSIAKNKQKQAQQRAGQPRKQPPVSPAKPVSPPKPAASAMSRQDDWDDEEDNWDERDMSRGRGMPAMQPRTAAAAMPKHETTPLEAHMHTPVMGVEGEGTEGVDCCHEYMLDGAKDAPAADFLPFREETENARAKTLLQGVIYSEILGRRPLKRYGGKRA